MTMNPAAPDPRRPSEKNYLALDCTICNSRKNAVTYDNEPGRRESIHTILACPQCDWIDSWPRFAP